jgi:uncharacterized protein (DUF58 family)
VKLFFKLLYRLYRIISALRYRAERRFTRAGQVMLGTLLLAGMMGPDTENNVAYQGFALLLGLLLVGVGFAFRFKARFDLERHLPRFGTVGCPLTYSVTLKNLSGRAQKGLSLLEKLRDPRPSFEDWVAVQRAEARLARPFRLQRSRTSPFKFAKIKDASVPPVAPRQSVEVLVELTPLRRGVLHFSGAILARSDPLGLCRAFRKLPAFGTTLILPRRYPVPPVAMPGLMKYQEGGVALASSVGQSDEFVSLRDYRPGDPMRHIHWRSWARVGTPVVKEFEDEFFVRHALVLDTFMEHPHSELFEEAVSVAASFACTVQSQESLLDLLFVGNQSYCFTAGRGLGQVEQILEILASVRPCHGQPFSNLEQLVLDHVVSVSGCICVLLAWDEERRQFVRKLKELGLPVLVLVLVEAGGKDALAHGSTTPSLPAPFPSSPGFHMLELGRIEQGLALLA